MTYLYKDRSSVFKLALLLSVLFLSSTAQEVQKSDDEGNCEDCEALSPSILLDPTELTMYPDDFVEVKTSLQLEEAKWYLGSVPQTFQVLRLEGSGWGNGSIGSQKGTSNRINVQTHRLIPPIHPCKSNLRLPPEASPCNPEAFLTVIAEGAIFKDTRDLKVKGVAPRLVIDPLPHVVVGEEVTFMTFVQGAGGSKWRFSADLHSRVKGPVKSQITGCSEAGGCGFETDPIPGDEFEITIKGGMESRTTNKMRSV